VALVYYYFDDNPRQMLDKGRATLIVTTLMVGTHQGARHLWHAELGALVGDKHPFLACACRRPLHNTKGYSTITTVCMACRKVVSHNIFHSLPVRTCPGAAVLCRL
jgi:hypothetical protein